MKLKAGDLAPGFRVTDIEGKIVDLAEYRGDPVLICFYRYAGCPYCNLYLHEIIAARDAYQRLGLRIVAFFQSRQQALVTIPARQKPGFPLVADPGKIIYDAYGVESSAAKMAISLLHLGTFARAHRLGFPQRKIDGDFFLLPAEFLIGPDGVIRTAHYAAHLSDHLTPEEILDFLSGAKNRAEPPRGEIRDEKTLMPPVSGR